MKRSLNQSINTFYLTSSLLNIDSCMLQNDSLSFSTICLQCLSSGWAYSKGSRPITRAQRTTPKANTSAAFGQYFFYGFVLVSWIYGAIYPLLVPLQLLTSSFYFTCMEKPKSASLMVSPKLTRSSATSILSSLISLWQI